MRGYHKIQSLFKRDPATNYKTFLPGQFTLPEFELLQNVTWEFTEKIDGTNIRVGWYDGKVLFGGKTDNANIPGRLVQWLTETFTAEAMSKALGDQGGITLYGEGYGAGIQKGGGYHTGGEQRFILFDVLYTGGPEDDCEIWLERKTVDEFAGNLDILSVPIVGEGNLGEAIRMAKTGYTSNEGTCQAEGIVLRPAVELKNRQGGRIISKLKYKDFVD